MWKVEMLARKAGWWISDGKIFSDMREANEHANRLSLWSFVTKTRIVPVVESSN